MTSTYLPFGLVEVVALVLVLALNAYVLTGGADFGGGVWDLLARGPRRDAQRALIAHAIGPIWEANHVWLILAIVILFTGFPDAFATLGTVLHIPLSLLLVGIVLRGSSFVFRSYGSPADAAQRRWGRVFAIASAFTPVMLGIVVGAVASGAAGLAQARLPTTPATSVGEPARQGQATFASVFVESWLAPFPLAMGALALAMFAFLAAVYLALAASPGPVREDFRRRALGSSAAVFVAAFTGLAVAQADAPSAALALTDTPGALAFQLATGLAALTAIWALWRRRWRTARVAAAAQVSLILWGWVLSQYPYIIPPYQRLHAFAAPPATLRLLLAAMAAGALVLIPALAYLYRTFAPDGDPIAVDRAEAEAR